MSIEEQLIELVGQTVSFDKVDPVNYKAEKPLEVKQDYRYVVDWIDFTSEDVVRVHNRTIFFTPEMLDAIDACIEIRHPPEPPRDGLTTIDVPDWVFYAGYNLPYDPYDI